MDTLFLQNTIAVIWDFDKTLTPKYMQGPLFNKFQVDEQAFWKEVEGLQAQYSKSTEVLVNLDTVYLNHILTYVKEGKFAGLTNKMLFELGAEIEFCNGIPDIFENLRKICEDEPYKSNNITVEHYIISTGIRQMILGSKVSPYMEQVWACEFADVRPKPGYLDEPDPNESGDGAPTEEPPITDIAYSIDNTSKTRALFEINKGIGKIKGVTVNSSMAPNHRRVPFTNMIYVADGPSDIPVFSIVRQYKGRAFAVYNSAQRKTFQQAKKLQDQGRVDAFGSADYSPDSHSTNWLIESVKEIADRIIKDRTRLVEDQIGGTPSHVI